MAGDRRQQGRGFYPRDTNSARSRNYYSVAELANTRACGGRSNSKPKYSIPLKLSGRTQRERARQNPVIIPLRSVGSGGVGWSGKYNEVKRQLFDGSESLFDLAASSFSSRKNRNHRALFIPADFTANISSTLLAMHANVRRVSMEQRRG